jgi:hypothetical protein
MRLYHPTLGSPESKLRSPSPCGLQKILKKSQFSGVILPTHKANINKNYSKTCNASSYSLLPKIKDYRPKGFLIPKSRFCNKAGCPALLELRRTPPRRKILLSRAARGIIAGRGAASGSASGPPDGSGVADDSTVEDDDELDVVVGVPFS